MTDREILEDFIVFYLCQYDELLSDVIYFFYQKKKVQQQSNDDPFDIYITIEPNYIKYIHEYIEIDGLFDDEINTSNLKSLTDLISDNKIKNLANYLNDNFHAGFPNDIEDGLAYGGGHELDITADELLQYFDNHYLKFHRLNPNLYISFLNQFFTYNRGKAELKITIEKNEIDRLNIMRSVLPFSEKDDFEKKHNNIYNKKKQDAFSNKPFQFYGFVDQNGFFFDDKSTFEKWVILSNGFQFEHELDSISDDKIGVDYLINKYYRYKFYNEDTVESSDDKINTLKRNFNKIKKDNRKLILFLNDKGFDDYQCDTILNVLLNNKFSELNLRSLPYVNKGIKFYRFCYLVYIFDFFEEVEGITFSKESDFECLLIDKSYHNSKSNWKNQFEKYKKNLKNTNSRHFPFRKTVEKTLDTIENKLAIKREKLKSF